MSKYYCFINGDIIPVEDANIHISDLGLLRSYAVFDYLRTYNGKPFRLKNHLQRFRNSACELMLPLNYSDREIAVIIKKLFIKSKKPDVAVRLLLTGGYSKDSMTVTEPNFIVIIENLKVPANDLYKKGVGLITFEYQREIPTIKSTQYLNAIKLEPLKEKYGVYDVLYCFNEEVLEVPRNNFFVFKDKALITPKDNILQGVTRKVILELAKGVFKVEVRKVLRKELKEADEAFICGTTKKIIPVVKIDRNIIGNGKVGPLTVQMMMLFDKYVNSF